jgi:FHS family L-fucose permease-like MFS transporter
MNQSKSMVLVSILFFLFGFITCLNDILVPHLKELFTLNYAQAMLVQLCFFSAYFFMSVPSGWLVTTRGYRFGIVGGLLTATIGTLGFLPAAQLGSYPIFLLSFFILASGITLLQVAVNPYVTLLGDPKLASFRLNMVQFLNSFGTFLAPYLGSMLILASVDKVLGVQIPYFFISVILGSVAWIFWKLPMYGLTRDSSFYQTTPELFSSSLKKYVLVLKKFPHLKHGMWAIFCYVGAEVSIGSFMVSWLTQGQVAGMTVETAGKYVAFYWCGAMIGRFFGSFLTALLKPVKVLQFAGIGAIALVVIAITTQNSFLATWALIAVGLMNSIQFPTIFSLSVQGMEEDTPYASGLLCTCIVGGALIPYVQGVTADAFGLMPSYIIPILCYAYIAWISPKLLKKA